MTKFKSETLEDCHASGDMLREAFKAVGALVKWESVLQYNAWKIQSEGLPPEKIEAFRKGYCGEPL